MFVLSIVRPPVEPAAFGQATVLDPVAEIGAVQRRIEYILTSEGVNWSFAASFGLALTADPTGWDITEPTTGFTFRVDLESRAPNACPCCGRLVNWLDHALAGSDDAYCLGCFTWKRGMTPCLPENSAHTEEETD